VTAAAPLALIHCSLAHGGVWRGFLAAAGTDAVSIELPGHGQAPDWDGVEDFQTVAVRQAMAALPDGPVRLIGHSFGGTVALRIALETPERVAELVLIEPPFFAAAMRDAWDVFLAYAGVNAPFAKAMAAGDREGAAAAFMGQWGGPVPWNRMAERQRTYMRDRIHLIAAAEPAIIDDNRGVMAEGRLAGLTMPVTLVEGSEAPPIVGAILDALEARIPDVRRVVIDGAGHMVPVTHGAELAAALGMPG